jgi:Bacterial Ig domain/Bacterial Ig-like domain
LAVHSQPFGNPKEIRMKIHTRWFGPTFLASTLMAVLVACPAPTPSPAPITGDTTKPTVSLASSSTNITTAGSITLTATASDNVGVTKVEFYDGTSKLGEDSSAGDGFTQAVPLTSSSNGSKSYTAKAFDAAGNTQTSTALVMTVNIAVIVADTTRPTLTASTALSSTSVQLVMSEPIVGGDVASNFKLTSDGQTIALAVTAANVLSDGKTVTLTTAAQTASDQYILVVNATNVKDLAGNTFDPFPVGGNPLLFTIFGFTP